MPFFLWGCTALATGRGEQVQPLDLAADLSLLIVKPPFGLATAEVYGRYQSGGAAAPPVDNLLHALAGADPRQVGRWLYNDLERPALALRPDLAAARQLLLDLGTYGCLLSGSGSSLFALLPEQGLLSLQQLEQALPPGFQVWQVQMVPACSVRQDLLPITKVVDKLRSDAGGFAIICINWGQDILSSIQKLALTLGIFLEVIRWLRS